MKRKVLTALLAMALAAGALTGCGNKAEGDGKVQAAMTDDGDSKDGNVGSLGSETPKAVLGETTEPTAEPVPAVTAEPIVKATTEPTAKAATEPTTKPEPAVTSAPTAEPEPAVTSAPTAEPTPIVTSAPTAEPTPTVTSQPAPDGGEQAGEQINSQSGNTLVASVKTDVSAELYNSEFIALLNADREAMGLNPVSDNGTLDANALASAEAVAGNYSHDAVVRGNANRENIGYVFENNVEEIYEAWKNSEGHWNAMIDPYLEYCSVARYNGFWVFLGYAGNPILDMSTQEAVEKGLLEHINTTDEGSEVYASVEGDVHVETEEEKQQAEDLGWDW